MTRHVETTQENGIAESARQSKSVSGVVENDYGRKNPFLEGQLIEEQLGIHTETESNIKSVSKELFNSDKIDVKTELSHDEINMVTKLRFLERKFKLRNIDVLVGSLLTLRVSKDRKSRSEFIQALRSEDQDAQQSGFLKKFLGAGK